MAQNFPSLSSLKTTFLQVYETAIGQDSPLNNKAFLRITSTVLAFVAKLLQKEVQKNTLENLAITASRAGLIKIGNNYNLPIKEEISTVLNATLPATTDTVILAGTNFTGNDNGIIYYNESATTAVAGVATLELTSRTPGVIGNLAASQTLTISRQIAGAELIATITSVGTTGAEAEETEVYRQRVLDIIRAPGGGGNSADFRNWAQITEGVVRAFPYAGLPWDDSGFPGASPERTVYIQCDTSIDSDGIPPGSLLDSVRENIITDPDTNQHRQALGLTNDTLYVEPIRRTAMYVEVRNAIFVTGTDAQVKADISTALTQYFLTIQPFVQGLDLDADRNDLITDLTVGTIIQGVLAANGASAEEVAFGEAPAASIPSYQLGQGEKTKLGGVSYVTT